jgi:hypothetical protein
MFHLVLTWILVFRLDSLLVLCLRSSVEKATATKGKVTKA